MLFNGKDVERFINKVENIAEIEGESVRDIARKLAFWTKNEEISYHIEGIPAYKTAYWDQLKEVKVLIQQKEFSKPKPPEKKTRFEDESWDELLKQVKELTHKLKTPPQPEPQPRNEVKESVKEVLNQLKTLSEAVHPPRRNWNNNQEQRFPQNNQPYRPRNPLPPFESSYKPYIPAQMSPRPPLKCAYCKEEGHSETRCNHLAEDLEKIIVRTQGASYLFPNYQRVPMEGNESAKDIVRAFAKEQELNKKNMEKTTVK
ncbi:hypothetical protein O181_011723 [Austropuccinia psidii MF-1]|uniref:Uncharacterized protein n=1 Tax=Austropuccinia psidii MF-1 TaxID=1389203 RepID=A0A9Q3BVE3_9BASI|nr:hypothetical protein [Austropuccinia psidii MF-1]